MFDRRCSRPDAAKSLLFTVHSFASRSSRCISTAQARRIAGLQNLVGWRGCSRCGAVLIFGLGDHFSWQRGKPRALVV